MDHQVVPRILWFYNHKDEKKDELILYGPKTIEKVILSRYVQPQQSQVEFPKIVVCVRPARRVNQGDKQDQNFAQINKYMGYLK